MSDEHAYQSVVHAPEAARALLATPQAVDAVTKRDWGRSVAGPPHCSRCSAPQPVAYVRFIVDVSPTDGTLTATRFGFDSYTFPRAEFNATGWQVFAARLLCPACVALAERALAGPGEGAA